MAVKPVGMYKVRRPFDANGARMVPGELVDVTEWRNAYQLVDRGYLVAAPDEKVQSRKKSGTAASMTEAVEADPEPVVVRVRAEDAPAVVACKRCGAVGDEPCVSNSGKPTNRHSGRL